jgi:hypothetical protein
MSNTPGISPITPDIEEVRHSEDDAFVGNSDEASEDGADDNDEESSSGEDERVGRNLDH